MIVECVLYRSVAQHGPVNMMCEKTVDGAPNLDATWGLLLQDLDERSNVSLESPSVSHKQAGT